MKSEEKMSINEIRQALHTYLVCPQFSSEKAVELYCFINKKWGAVEYDEHGHNPVAIIKNQYK